VQQLKDLPPLGGGGVLGAPAQLGNEPAQFFDAVLGQPCRHAGRV
jgi:hypothetical protein